MFAARADQQVRIRQVSERDMPPDRRLVDRVGRHLAADAPTRQLLRRASDVPPTSIRDCDDQGHAPIACGARHGRLHAAAQGGRQLFQVADKAQPNVVLVQLVDFIVERFEEASHEHGHLVLRTLPVLARECEQRQHFDAAARAVLDGLLHRAHAHAMSGRTRQCARRGPTTVAVHDHRDVPRDGRSAWRLGGRRHSALLRRAAPEAANSSDA